MMHKKRVFSVADITSPEELAAKLTAMTWTLCTGFRMQGYLFLNDSTSEDGAQEYAVVRVADIPGSDHRQVESITFGWCDLDNALRYIREALAGDYDEDGRPLPALRLEYGPSHRCHLCA